LGYFASSKAKTPPTVIVSAAATATATALLELRFNMMSSLRSELLA
jgi:hypothetical protein